MPKVYLTKADSEYAAILREINGTLKEQKMRIEDLARSINKDRTTLGRKLSGKSALTVPELLAINEVLKGGNT